MGRPVRAVVRQVPVCHPSSVQFAQDVVHLGTESAQFVAMQQRQRCNGSLATFGQSGQMLPAVKRIGVEPFKERIYAAH